MSTDGSATSARQSSVARESEVFGDGLRLLAIDIGEHREIEPGQMTEHRRCSPKGEGVTFAHEARTDQADAECLPFRVHHHLHTCSSLNALIPPFVY